MDCDSINVLRDETSRDEINVRTVVRNKRKGTRPDIEAKGVKMVMMWNGSAVAGAQGWLVLRVKEQQETMRWRQELLYCIRGWRNDGNTT